MNTFSDSSIIHLEIESKIYKTLSSKTGFDFKKEIESCFFVSKNVFDYIN
ncbi:MAG TPA: hypothetical protein P5060_03770 [Candidatus Absconditabacterales bacterium]|nr:hypothetical protein [Candidatus Absconditabacterales bacterium]